MNRALFLDRDGIINRLLLREEKWTSPRNIKEFEIIPEAVTLCKTAKELGFFLALITNQPDVSRGLLSRGELKKMHTLIKEQIPLDHIEVCTSSNDAYFRRKPNPGMLLNCAHTFNLSLPDSFFLGDSLKDLQAGNKAKVITILLQTDYNIFIHGLADMNCNSLNEVETILKNA